MSSLGVTSIVRDTAPTMMVSMKSVGIVGIGSGSEGSRVVLLPAVPATGIGSPVLIGSGPGPCPHWSAERVLAA